MKDQIIAQYLMWLPTVAITLLGMILFIRLNRK